MSLNDNEKINYITNNFHQYFDLHLNKNISTTETVNLVIPVEDLGEEDIANDSLEDYSHNITFKENYKIEDILSKYDDTDLDGIMGICTKVIDGDTIYVNIPRVDENNNVVYTLEKIRLVGINTPEESQPGADVSKEFIEKICYSKEYLIKIKKEEELSKILEEEYESLSQTEKDAVNAEIAYYSNVVNTKKIYLKFDSQRAFDNSGKRRLAVLIYKYKGIDDDNNEIIFKKNINEVLLKEGLAEIWYIPPSEFNPFEWGDSNTHVHIYNFQNSDINFLSPYFNSNMTNVVFTPKNDPKTIYKYEFYNGIYFVKLQPFSQDIRMHLLPKAYDCSNTILFFKDDMLKEDNVNISDDYYHFTEANYINSYYLSGENEIRDRENPNISSQQYNPNDWTNTFCYFSYNISKNTRNIDKLQICGGYRYNRATPYYSIHYMGVRDNTNIAVEDRCTLVDANLDGISNRNPSDPNLTQNNITQFSYNNQNGLYIPKNPVKIREKYNGNIDHVNEVGKIYHKTLKYINDILYSQEGKKENIKHATASWKDISMD